MTNGYGEVMNDKENMTSAYDGSSSSTRQMTALRAAQAMFANAAPPPPTVTGNDAWPCSICVGWAQNTFLDVGYLLTAPAGCSVRHCVMSFVSSFLRDN